MNANRREAFTLLELIVVIIIIGVLATLGFTQYTNVLEKVRTAEAIANVSIMRKLAYEYYLKNGSLTTIANSDVAVDRTCRTGNFYKYWVGATAANYVDLCAGRCAGCGKSPSPAHDYVLFYHYVADSGASYWSCYYTDDCNSSNGTSCPFLQSGS